MNHLFQNRAPLSFFISDFFLIVEKSKLFARFFADFCAVQLRVISKKTPFLKVSVVVQQLVRLTSFFTQGSKLPKIFLYISIRIN